MKLKNLRLTFNGRVIGLDSFIRILIKPIFILFIYFGVFGRFDGFFGLSGGMAAVLLGFVLFFLAIFHLLFINESRTISQLTYLITAFFVLLCLIPFVSSFIYDERIFQVLTYSIEVFLGFTMFFSIYYFIKTGFITPKFFLFSFAFIGAFVSVQLVFTLADASAIRRLTGLGGGLNYVGSSLAMCALVWIMLINSAFHIKKNYKFKRIYPIVCFIIVFLVLILTGTRAGFLAFLIGIFLLQILGIQSRKFTRYIFITGVVVGVIMLYIASKIDLSLLFDRFSYENISEMAAIRFAYYARAITDLTLVEFIVGRPDLYTFSDDTGDSIRFINTHNIFLSLLRYNGVLPFILFTLILIIIFAKYITLYFQHKDNRQFRLIESSIIILLIMALIYSMFSGGRITRIFIIFIQLGYAVGYFELLSRLKSYDDYKKLLL